MIRTNTLSDVAPGKSVPQCTNDAILFGPDSVGSTSHVFTVRDTPVVIMGFNLSKDDELVLEQVGGKGSGQYFQACTFRDVVLLVSAQNTFLNLDIRGRFRLRHYGSTPVGAFYVELIR